MYNNSGIYQAGGQLYPWNQTNADQTGTGNVYYNQYVRTFSQNQVPIKNLVPVTGNYSPSRKSRTEFESSYQPDPALPAYSGPYPVDQLQKARSSLIDSLLYDSSDVIQRVKPKIGIDSCYGTAYDILPPAPIPETKVVSAAQGSRDAPSTSTKAETCSKNPNLRLIPPATVTSSSTSLSPHTPKNLITLVSNSTTGQSINRSDSNTKLSKKRKATDDISEVKSKKNTADDTSLHVYKCDFCVFQCNTSTFIEHHLKEARHFSASLYNTRNGQLVSVEKKLAVKNTQGKNEALVVVCPGCHDIFEDIFMCGVHYKYTHGGDSNNGFFSVCPVVHQETVFVYQSATCQVCKVIYEKQKNLHRHWENEPTHHPLSKMLSTKAFALYSCLYCNKAFHTDFLSCKSHVLGHRDNSNQLRARSALKVRHIMLPTRKDEVLPLSETSSQDGFTDEMTMLRNMKTHFNGMSGTKSKVRLIEERIQYLVKFRDAHLDQTFKFS